MPDLTFEIVGAKAVPFAVAPLLGFDLRLTNKSGETIHTVALRVQIQIEAPRRSYTPVDQESLRDLFGEPARWGQTLRTMLWTHAGLTVPAFDGSTLVELPVPCTFDFNIAAVKYFQGLENGEIPLCFQFSGIVFYQGQGGALQVTPIPWDREARFRLPVKVWQEMRDLYYPNSAWLCLGRDVFDRLYQYKVENGITSWEEMLDGLLATAPEKVMR